MALVNDSAADTYAQITRDQYDHWLETFYPKQRQLLDQTQSGALLDEQLGRVNENMNSSMRAAEQAKSNQMARYGVASKPAPNQAAQQALATSTAKNSLRDYEKDRSLHVLAGTNSNAMKEMAV